MSRKGKGGQCLPKSQTRPLLSRGDCKGLSWGGSGPYCVAGRRRAVKGVRNKLVEEHITRSAPLYLSTRCLVLKITKCQSWAVPPDHLTRLKPSRWTRHRVGVRIPYRLIPTFLELPSLWGPATPTASWSQQGPHLPFPRLAKVSGFQCLTLLDPVFGACHMDPRSPHQWHHGPNAGRKKLLLLPPRIYATRVREGISIARGRVRICSIRPGGLAGLEQPVRYRPLVTTHNTGLQGYYQENRMASEGGPVSLLRFNSPLVLPE